MVPSIIVGIKRLSSFFTTMINFVSTITVTELKVLFYLNPPLVTNTFSLKDALKGLYPIAAEWNNLGKLLANTLDMIMSNPHHDRLGEMLSV